MDLLHDSTPCKLPYENTSASQLDLCIPNILRVSPGRTVVIGRATRTVTVVEGAMRLTLIPFTAWVQYLSKTLKLIGCHTLSQASTI